ncbi:MAG: beta-galactosidase, partial [Eubacteriales bacterium]|nr:beta-galactosidase [Eubacteriales bacterium]
VSEFGGIWWNPRQKDGKAWGYGNRPESEAAFLRRFRGLVDALLDNPAICAFCYTQLTDVEQEVNGLYTYDRQVKFPPEQIRAIVSREAAIERQD